MTYPHALVAVSSDQVLKNICASFENSILYPAYVLFVLVFNRGWLCVFSFALMQKKLPKKSGCSKKICAIFYCF
jgi:hypothetical protein